MSNNNVILIPLCSTVQVISAHNLPKPQGSGAKGEVIDPYVVLELHGVPADCAEQRTRTAAQNQDDPLFDETFEFQVRHFNTVHIMVPVQWNMWRPVYVLLFIYLRDFRFFVLTDIQLLQI